jgi:membrane protein EpsK
MVLSLSLWHSIRMLGVMYAGAVTINGLAQITTAHRVCPSLKVRLHLADRATMGTMLRFGGKTFMNGLARSFLYQMTAVLMTSYLGPAALAVYNRPLALVNQLRGMCGKFANTLTPIASELQAGGHHDSLQDMAGRMARVGAALSLPPVVFVSIMGGCILRVWMGKGYADNLLPAILAVGSLWAISNMPLQTILIGLDAHGPPALVSVLSSAVCAGACWLLLGLGGAGIHSVSLCVGLTLLLTDGAFVTFYTCRRIGVSASRFLREVWTVPFLCVTPFALCLLAARLFLPPLWALACGVAAGAGVLAPLYWRWIFSEEIRAKIRGKLGRIGRKAPGRDRYAQENLAND